MGGYSVFSRSTGLMTVTGAANVPTPVKVISFDVIDGPGMVSLYDGTSNAGTLIAQHNAATFACCDLGIPVRCDTGLYVELEAANTVVRYV